MHKLDDERLAAALAAAEEAGTDRGAVLEAMFLMAAADGEVSEVEIAQFASRCGPLVGEVAPSEVEGMFLEWGAALEEEGWERRVRSVGKALVGTPLAEVAFRAAVAVALADDYVVGAESHAMDVLAEALGIGLDEAHGVVREVYDELFGAG